MGTANFIAGTGVDRVVGSGARFIMGNIVDFLTGSANKVGAAVAVIIGDDELANDVATVRDMDSGEQREEPVAALVEFLAPYR